MRRLGKKTHLNEETIEAYCNCFCECNCACGCAGCFCACSSEQNADLTTSAGDNAGHNSEYLGSGVMDRDSRTGSDDQVTFMSTVINVNCLLPDKETVFK